MTATGTAVSKAWLNGRSDTTICFPTSDAIVDGMRWEAVHNDRDIRDPFDSEGPRSPFHTGASDFLRLARSHPPSKRGQTVSDFTSWIYSLYTSRTDSLALEYGLKMERPIFRERSKLTSDKVFSWIEPSAWELLHNGLRIADVNGNRVASMEIPDLKVDGSAIHASPDLIYVHKTTRAAILIEIKFSLAKIPTNLWPNVWAQLWAYSKIPELQSAPSISAVAEVWAEQFDQGHLKSRGATLYLRATKRKNPRNAAFDRFFTELFRIYSGQLR